MTLPKKKLLHLVDDSFFTDFIILNFEKANPGLNDYAILRFKKTKIRYIKNKSHIQIIRPLSIDFFQLLLKTRNYQALMLHMLTPLKAWFTILSSKKTKLVWFAWGSDLYNPINKLRSALYQPKTKKIIQNYIFKKWLTREIIVPFLSLLFNPLKYVIGKVDYCAPVFFEEFELIKDYLNKECIYIPFSYASIERKKADGQSSINQTNILLGNNALPTNNHFEILQLLSEIDLKNRKIITPLSYGYNSYKKIIIKKCPENIRSNFYPLTSFIPKEEYLELINTCGFAIFNFNRQQGVGNIIELLASGCKIFINENTTTWRFLKRIGITVFSIQNDLNTANINAFDPLSDENKKRNNEIIEREYSNENIKIKFDNCIRTIYNTR